MSYSILIISALLALLAIFLNLSVIPHVMDKTLKRIVITLLLFTSMRYVALIIYGDSPTYELLQVFRYFYFASSIGLTMTTLLAIWYVLPILRKRFKSYMVPLIFLPWNLFYIYVIVKQPTEIIKGNQFGYQLQLIDRFPFYLSIVQGSLVTIIILICLYGIYKYKHLQIRVQLIFIIAAQVLLALDGISFSMSLPRVFMPFTITEAFGFAATYYAYKKAVK